MMQLLVIIVPSIILITVVQITLALLGELLRLALCASVNPLAPDNYCFAECFKVATVEKREWIVSSARV